MSSPIVLTHTWGRGFELFLTFLLLAPAVVPALAGFAAARAKSVGRARKGLALVLALCLAAAAFVAFATPPGLDVADRMALFVYVALLLSVFAAGGWRAGRSIGRRHPQRRPQKDKLASG